MASTFRAAVFATALLAAAPVRAEEPAQAVRVGLGVGLNTSFIGSLLSAINQSVPATQLYVPVALTPRFRLEPSLGWAATRDDQNDQSASTLSLGIGAFYLKPVASQVQAYAGARATASWTSSEEATTGATVKIKATNVALAAAAGAEYLFSPAFSLGVEGQLQHVFLGDRTATASGVSGSLTEKGGSTTSTEGLFFLRAYFF